MSNGEGDLSVSDKQISETQESETDEESSVERASFVNASLWPRLYTFSCVSLARSRQRISLLAVTKLRDFTLNAMPADVSLAALIRTSAGICVVGNTNSSLSKRDCADVGRMSEISSSSSSSSFFKREYLRNILSLSVCESVVCVGIGRMQRPRCNRLFF